jgi:hypothetical protein
LEVVFAHELLVAVDEIVPVVEVHGLELVAADAVAEEPSLCSCAVASLSLAEFVWEKLEKRELYYCLVPWWLQWTAQRLDSLTHPHCSEQNHYLQNYTLPRQA